MIGYGHTGPYRTRPGYDVMVEAEGGLMYITGEQGGTPVKVGVAVTGKILNDLGSQHLFPSDQVEEAVQSEGA
jgi:hypothetical protein